MDNKYLFGLTLFATLGSGLIAGLFYVFSVFVMRALDRLPPAQGIAAMQSINKTIITPLFLLVFMGVAVASVALAGIAAFALDGPERVWLIAGSLLYLVGVILLTGGYHVPRNDALDAIDPNSAGAASFWADYVKNWTAWNHVRAVSSLAAMASFIMAIRVG